MLAAAYSQVNPTKFEASPVKYAGNRAALPGQAPATLPELGVKRSKNRPKNVGALVKFGIRDLDFFPGASQALTTVTLDIADRSVTPLVGPSGHGENGLVRTLSRLYHLVPGQRATGAIMIAGRNSLDAGTDLKHLRSTVGMLFKVETPFPISV